MKCSNCQHAFSGENYRFCGYCGISLVKTCPHCKCGDMPLDFQYCGYCRQPFEGAETPPSPASPQAEVQKQVPELVPVEKSEPKQPRDERRDVSILFADVKGYTSMSEKLDPEEVHTIMNDCFEGLGSAIKEQEGYVDKYIGDNVMALFGAPVAHEDDPARACRAAIVMQTFLKKFAKKWEPKIGIKLQMRIGINCGLVVAAGVGSEDVKKDYTVMGDTVNLAARLESSAQPGTILVSEDIMNRTHGQFQFGPLQEIKVKGKENAVNTYELLSEIGEFDPRGRDGLSVSLIGRQQELEKLVHRIKNVHDNNEWIDIRGEMGMGKTRLVEEALKTLPRKKCIRTTLTPLLKKRSFGMIHRLLGALMNQLSDNSEIESKDAFTQILHQLSSDLDLYAPALWYLSAPTQLHVSAPDQDPQTLRRTIEQGMLQLVKNFSEKYPQAFLFIDSYEFSDPESADWLESLYQRAEGLPITVLITSRLEGRNPLNSKGIIDLDPLSKNNAEGLLKTLVRKAKLPPSLSQDILKRTKGIPLHLEEMVRTLLNKGVLNKNASTWEFNSDKMSEGLILPASIRAAMTSRLDLLGSAEQDLLNQCSIQGVDFDVKVVEVLRLSPGRQGTPPNLLLQELKRKDFVGPVPEDIPSRLMFSHPLMRDTCYETQMKRDRQTLHFETALALCKLVNGEESVPPEILAYHYDYAEAWHKSAKAHYRCGNFSSELFLNDEAIKHYTQAVQSVRNLNEEMNEEDKELTADAISQLAKVYLRIGKYPLVQESIKQLEPYTRTSVQKAEAKRLSAMAYQQTGDVKKAETLFREIKDAEKENPESKTVYGETLFNLANLYFHENRSKDALLCLESCHSLQLDPIFTIRLDMLEGTIAHTQGHFQDAVSFYEKAYENAKKVSSLSEWAKASNYLGNGHRDQGQYKEAQKHYSNALKLWEKMGDVQGIAGAHNNLGNVYMSLGNFSNARIHQEKTLKACVAIGNTNGVALAQVNLAVLSNEENQYEDAIQFAKNALDTLGTSGSRLKALIQVILGEALLNHNDLPISEKTFKMVLKENDEKNHPLAVAGAYRGLGRIILIAGHSQDAIQRFEQAITLYAKLQRTQEEARTLFHLSEAYRQNEQLEKAIQILNQALESFKKMGATMDAQNTEKILRCWKSARKN